MIVPGICDNEAARQEYIEADLYWVCYCDWCQAEMNENREPGTENKRDQMKMVLE